MRKMYSKEELVELINDTVVMPEGEVMKHLLDEQLYPSVQEIINLNDYGTYDLIIIIVYLKDSNEFATSDIIKMLYNASGKFEKDNNILFYYSLYNGVMTITPESDIEDLNIDIWGLNA